MAHLKYFRLQFKPIKRKDRGTYTCFVQWSDDGLSRRKLSYHVTIRIQHKLSKPSKLKHAGWKSMNQEKRQTKAEEPTSKTRRQSDLLHESRYELLHIVGIVGENVVLNCSMPGELVFLFFFIYKNMIKSQLNNFLQHIIQK